MHTVEDTHRQRDRAGQCVQFRDVLQHTHDIWNVRRAHAPRNFDTS
jgi:hypothetical protein